MAHGLESMTRAELRSHENQLVQFDGWVESWTCRDDGTKDVLLKQLAFTPYDLNTVARQERDHAVATTDHVWLRVPPGTDYDSMRRLDHVFGYGRIGWYSRADGSVDLGLRSLCSVQGGRLAKELRTILLRGDWAAAERRLRDLRRRIQSQELVVFDRKSSATEILQDFEQVFLPLIAKNKATLATVHRGGKSKAPKSFADLLR
jgi:hypothetical protein